MTDITRPDYDLNTIAIMAATFFAHVDHKFLMDQTGEDDGILAAAKCAVDLYSITHSTIGIVMREEGRERTRS